MNAILVQKPQALPCDLSMIKSALGYDGVDYMDAQISMAINGLAAQVEHEIGQQLIRQHWQITLPAFQALIPVPHPVLDIVSINYLDASGVMQSVALENAMVKKEALRSYVRPARGYSWPATYADDEAVQIVVAVGFGDDHSSVPDQIKLFLLASLQEQFAPASQKANQPTNYLRSLLDSCRVYL